MTAWALEAISIDLTAPILSASKPNPMRLKNDAANSTDNMVAPVERENPMSVAWLMRCTIGTAIAVQHPTTARHNKAWTVPGECPSTENSAMPEP